MPQLANGCGGRGGFDLQHACKRGHASDRLLCERPTEGERAQQPAVEVDRRTAHARDDAGVLEARVVEANEDDLAVGGPGTYGPQNRERDLNPFAAIHLGNAHPGPSRGRVRQGQMIDRFGRDGKRGRYRDAENHVQSLHRMIILRIPTRFVTILKIVDLHVGRDCYTIRLRPLGYAVTGNDNLLVTAQPNGQSPMVRASRLHMAASIEQYWG